MQQKPPMKPAVKSDKSMAFVKAAKPAKPMQKASKSKGGRKC